MSRQYLFTEYGGPEVEAMRERPAPEPGPGQLLIEVRAAGVNPVDVKIREGRLGRERDLPAPMGREAAGIVTAVGPDVAGFAVGDEVLGLLARGEGGFADHALLSAASTVTKPEDIGFEVAASVPVAGTTAYDLTHQVELEAGQSLLVLGAGGGVGHLVTQIGRVHGGSSASPSSPSASSSSPPAPPSCPPGKGRSRRCRSWSRRGRTC